MTSRSRQELATLERAQWRCQPRFHECNRAAVTAMIAPTRDVQPRRSDDMVMVAVCRPCRKKLVAMAAMRASLAAKRPAPGGDTLC